MVAGDGRATDVRVGKTTDTGSVAQLSHDVGVKMVGEAYERANAVPGRANNVTFTAQDLEALSGKADSGDKKITVKEIDAYLQDTVPTTTQKYKGTPQYPASYGKGNDFPILLVK